MSYYDDGPRRAKSGRSAKTRDDDYDDQYTSRGGRHGEVRETSLVRRRDDSVSSVEEIDRDFAPGNGGYVKETTIRKHGVKSARARSYNGRDRYDDRYDDRDSYAESRRGGGYAESKRSSRRADDYDDRRDRRSRRYDSYSESSPSRSPPRRRKPERRKSTVEKGIEALGLGGVAAAVLGKNNERSRSRDRGGRGRDRGYSSDRSYRSRSRGGKSSRARSKSQGREKIVQSLKAAALAGITEGFRARNEPGGWSGAKGKRILTAAVGAAGVDGLITGTGGRDPEKHSTRHIIESAIGGLAAGRLVNGPRSQSRGRDRSPSQSRGGLGDLASGGILAAGAKKLYDRARSKSRGRTASRSDSYSSFDSRSPPRGGQKKRSKSITDYARNGLAALGVGGAAKTAAEGRNARDMRDHSSEDEYYREKYNGGGYADSREVGPPPSQSALPTAANGGKMVRGGYDYGPHHTGDPDTDSDSDLGSSSDEEKERRKGTGKQLISAGLATVATIHAVHSVYQSAEKHETREKELRKGEISEAEAKKQRNRGLLQDAASVGIAALGIKGAYSEWVETKDKRQEHKEEVEKFERHRAKRSARRHKQLAEARRYQESGFSGSMPNLSTGGYHGGGAPYSAGPGAGHSATPPPRASYYADDNPYGAMASGGLPPADYMQVPPAYPGAPH